MADFQLSEVDDEELSLSLLPQIEKSFGFKFEDDDLTQVATFGEFCDVILTKFPDAEANDCTSQQAFYKLRHLLTLHIPGAVITPNSPLSALLPHGRTSRKQLLQAVETDLGFPLDLVGMSAQTEALLFLAFFTALAALFVSWAAGASGLLLATALAVVASKLSDTIQHSALTVRDIVKKMTRQYYTQSRRSPHTVNRCEIAQQVKELFCHELDLEPTALTRNARF